MIHGEENQADEKISRARENFECTWKVSAWNLSRRRHRMARSAFDGRLRLPGALPFYIQAAEIAKHPGLRPSASRCTKNFVTRSDQFGLTIAKTNRRTSRLAMGLMYLILDTTEADNFDRKYDGVRNEVEGVADAHGFAGDTGRCRLGGKTLPQCCLATALFIHMARAASGTGPLPEDAASLTSNMNFPSKNDDLLLPAPFP